MKQTSQKDSVSISAEKKRTAEEKKASWEALEKQWKVNLQEYTEVVIPAWKAECAEIDMAWTAAKEATGKSGQLI